MPQRNKHRPDSDIYEFDENVSEVYHCLHVSETEYCRDAEMVNGNWQWWLVGNGEGCLAGKNYYYVSYYEMKVFSARNVPKIHDNIYIASSMCICEMAAEIFFWWWENVRACLPVPVFIYISSSSPFKIYALQPGHVVNICRDKRIVHTSWILKF